MSIHLKAKLPLWNAYGKSTGGGCGFHMELPIYNQLLQHTRARKVLYSIYYFSL